MKLTGICGRLTLVGLLCAVAACGGSSSSEVGTLAYVVSSCSETAGAATVRQELRIYHGKGETVTAMAVGPLGPFTTYGACGFLGRGRENTGVLVGAFQRLGVTPDGSGVVFELTDEFSSAGQGSLPAAQRGIYHVRADGSGLRRLGPASRFPAVIVAFPDTTYRTGGFNFDPSGRQFTFVDLGPDEAGEEAPQVFAQRLTTGDRRQLTRLPRVADKGEPPDKSRPQFTDARTIVFRRFAEPPDRFTYLTVDAVTSEISDVPTVALPGGTLIPAFQIIGAEWQALGANLAGEAVNPVPPNWSSISEVFVTDGTNVLQLTNFHRADTAPSAPFFSPRDQRVYFTASADPFGTNPSHDCQIFSIDPLTRDLRQVTFFHEGGDHTAGCKGGDRPNGCRIDFWGPPPQNPATGTIYFWSQCDPLGLNPNGNQLFTIQAEGAGLQQLTNARGFVRGADRTVEVETVEHMWAYAPPR